MSKKKSTRVILCDTKTGACYEAIGHEKLEKYLQRKKPSAVFIEYAEIVRHAEDDDASKQNTYNLMMVQPNPTHARLDEESCTITINLG